MNTYTVEHKYCHATHVIEGYDIYHALRANGLDPKVWLEVKEK